MSNRTRRWLAGAGAAVALAAGPAQAQTSVTTPLSAPELRFAAQNAGVTSLGAVTVPEPPNLATFVRDRTKLLQLGKALFWDQQLGSDGQACASCHFHAGADNRSKNQINPGFRSTVVPGGDLAFNNNGNGAPGPSPAFGPNRQLTAGDFPLHRVANPADRTSAVLSDTNDVVSSQGVFGAQLVKIGVPYDSGVPSTGSGPGATFNVGGVLVRSVEPRNTPSVVNAVFNDRNFWDSRARQEFNGVDPIGQLDGTAQVVEVVKLPGMNAGAFLHPVRITLASAASQAVGPPTSDLEMSFGGRRGADLGRKMLSTSLKPLALQLVSTTDGVLGSLSLQAKKKATPGISTTYLALVQAAFLPQWWDGGKWNVDLSSGSPVLRSSGTTGPNVFTVAEYNFSLFFGLAIREYEATLVANQTPFDRFMEGDNGALSPAAVRGLQTFLGKASCVRCHGGPELSNAGVTSIQRRGLLVEPGKGTHDLLERMVMGDGGVAVYDAGHYNIGVRPTPEDVGIGATIGPANLPLSNSRRLQDCLRAQVKTGATVQAGSAACGIPRILARPGEAAVLLRQAAQALGNPPDVIALLNLAADLLGPEDVLLFTSSQPMAAAGVLEQARDAMAALAPGDAAIGRLLASATMLLPDPVDPGFDELNPLAPPLQPDERLAVDGAFKAPSLRNVELTAPYFHNGGQATLAQVVEFYDRGGDFLLENAASADPLIRPLGLTADERSDLVAFLQALTDERTRYDRAPFDHPSLSFPNGGTPGVLDMTLFSTVGVMDDRILLPAVGSAGSSVPLGTSRTPFANFLDALR
jgi:cytochrome c peroxidase